MQKCCAEIGVSHLKTIVKSPERGAETVADSCETTARCRICFIHDKRLSHLLSEKRRVDIWSNYGLRCGVVKVLGKGFLRVDRWASTDEIKLCYAVIIRVPITDRARQSRRSAPMKSVIFTFQHSAPQDLRNRSRQGQYSIHLLGPTILLIC